jgi:hypothetical protein
MAAVVLAAAYGSATSQRESMGLHGPVTHPLDAAGTMLPVKFKPSRVRLRKSLPVIGGAAENSRLVTLLHDTVSPGTARRCNTCRVLEPVYHTLGSVPVRPLTSSSRNVERFDREPHVIGTV